MRSDRASGLRSFVVVSLALLAVSTCSNGAAEPTETTDSEGPAPGSPCSTPGQFLQSSDGESLICSSRSESGEELPAPLWRASTGRLSDSLTDDEIRAVDVVRQAYAAHPAGGTWPESEEITLLFVNEMASAAALASDQQIEPFAGFESLVNGYAGANQVSQDTAVAAISGLLLGVVELFGDDSDSGSYAVAMLEAAVEAAGAGG